MDTTFERAKALIDYSLDVFGGTDGGVSICHVRENLEKCIEKADQGDPTSTELLKIFVKYDKLLKAFSQPVNF